MVFAWLQDFNKQVFYSILSSVLGVKGLPYYPVHKEGAILVTGSSTGIGEDAVYALASKGFLVFAGVRKPSDGEKLASKHANIHPVILDVSQKETISSSLADIRKQLTEKGLKLIGLVNNAGVSYGSPVECLDLDEAKKLFDVNVWGLVEVTQAFLPLLRDGKGRIVNIGSIAGEITQPSAGLYAASKHAVEALSDALRQEVYGQGIAVSLIKPGAIATEIWSKGDYSDVLFKKTTPEQKQLYSYFHKRNLAFRRDQGSRGIPPSYVSRDILHALFSPVPRTRYWVGTDSNVISFVKRLISDRMLDFAMHLRKASEGKMVEDVKRE